jgi:hypothetical protein
MPRIEPAGALRVVSVTLAPCAAGAAERRRASSIWRIAKRFGDEFLFQTVFATSLARSSTISFSFSTFDLLLRNRQSDKTE